MSYVRLRSHILYLDLDTTFQVITHTHILLSIVTLYFSFTVITEIKHYQLKPHNYTLAEVYTYLVNF